jgi:hypothetical protein
MKKYIFFAVFLGLNLFCTFMQAQNFIQHGKTLVYNGRQMKTSFVQPVSISCHGASSTSNDHFGKFTLAFNNAQAGDVIASIDVSIGDNQYVWFNRENVSQWVLTSQKEMTIEVCDKKKIENLTTNYSKTYVTQLKRKYENERKRLQKEMAGNQELRKELNKLENDYKQEIEEIKLRSIEFAYVDETLLDSLDYEKRLCEINGDIEGAIKIGNQIDYENTLEDISENVKKSHEKAISDVNKLYTIAESALQHIKNCESVEMNFDSIKSLYKMVMPRYKQLIDLYNPENTEGYRCSDTFYETLRNRYGQLLYNYATNSEDSVKNEYMKLACSYDNVEAMWECANKLETDCEEAKGLLSKMLDICDKKSLLPADVKREDVVEAYESYPDFSIYQNGDSVYYHILPDQKVALCLYQRYNKRNIDLEIPTSVMYNGKKYIVTKIGRYAFDNTDNNDYMDFMDSIRSIILPNTITHIGQRAFSNYKRMSRYIPNIPKSLKFINDGAFFDCTFKNRTVVLPEGLEYIGDAWRDDTYGDSTLTNLALTIFIPSTVTKIDAFKSMPRYAPRIEKLYLNRKNKNFTLINNLLYTADTTFFYRGTILRPKDQTIILYLSRNMTMGHNVNENYAFDDDISGGIYSDVDSVALENNHQYYAIYDGALYSKDLKRLIFFPGRGRRSFQLPSSLKELVYDYYLKANTVRIPNDIDANVIVSLFYDLVYDLDDSVYFEIEGHKKAMKFFEAADADFQYNQLDSLCNDVLSSDKRNVFPYALKREIYATTGNIRGMETTMNDMESVGLNNTDCYRALSDTMSVAYKRLYSYLQTGDSLMMIRSFGKAKDLFDNAYRYLCHINLYKESYIWSYILYRNKQAVCYSYVDNYVPQMKDIYDDIFSKIDTLRMRFPASVNSNKAFLSQIYRNAATVYMGSKNDLVLAEKYMKKSIELCSEDIDRYDILGIIYIKQKKEVEAQNILTLITSKFSLDKVKGLSIYSYFKEKKK